ncbi:MAG: DUF2812 domain-containing protein [Terrisporobacter sp.]
MMKERKKLTELIFFRENECKAMEEYLAEKAAQGWMLEEINLGFFSFKKVQPTYCRFAVDIFDDLNFAEYREYCEASGWNYLCCTGRYLIFTTVDENTIPIQTDEELVLKKIRKSIMAYLLLTIMLVLNFINIIRKGFIMGEVYKTENLFILILVLIFTSFLVTEVITDTSWYVKIQINIKSGSKIRYKTLKSLKIKNIYMKLYMYAFIIVLISSAGLHFGNEYTYEYSWWIYIFALILGVITSVYKVIKINRA